MRKIIAITVIALIVLSGAARSDRQLITNQSDRDQKEIAVLFSEQYFSSHDGKTIRSLLRRTQRSRAAKRRNQRLIYRFIKFNEQKNQLYTAVQEQITDGTEVIISFEPQLSKKLLEIATLFPKQRFYLADEQNDSHHVNDNIYTIDLELYTYNYLLGYFTSLLFHYRFANQPQSEVAIMAIDNGANSTDRHAVVFGLQSVATEHKHRYIGIAPHLTREQIFNLFEELKRDNVEAVVLLTPAVAPRPFFRAAARNNIALVTQASRRYLRGAQVAQREIDWSAIINNRLIPHIQYNRKRNIIGTDNTHYNIRHRPRIRDAEIAELVTLQLNNIIEKIILQEVNISF